MLNNLDQTSLLPAMPQTLLMDADDTLWENNIYFEQAIASFIALLDHQVHSSAEVRAVLNRCEHATIQQHGYGTGSFERSLLDCFWQLSHRPLNEEMAGQIRGFARSIAEHAIELLDGVAETLPLLAARHRVILVTKGNAVEQVHKLERSGIREHFRAVEVPPEKDVDAYSGLIERYELNPAATWMIGNSPRSDINPALAAGLHAVLVEHPHTWVLEHETIDTPVPPQKLFQIASFADLAPIFLQTTV